MDRGDEPDLTRELLDAARHRTNVRVESAVGAASKTWQGRLASLSHADYVLLLPAGWRAMPSALEALVAAADRDGADVCVGVVGSPKRRAGAPDQAVVLTEPGRLLRRAVLGDGAASVEATVDAVTFVDGPDGAAAVPDDSTGSSHSLRATEVRWREGVLDLTLVLSPPLRGPARPAVSVFSTVIGVEWPVDTSAVRVLDASEQESTFQITLDPATLAAGEGLSEGMWWPRVRIQDADREIELLARVRPQKAAGATYDGRSVVTFAEGGRLGIDVGATDHPLVPRIPAGRARVQESAGGSLMTCGIPELDMPPGARLRGHVGLGRFEIPAFLEGLPEGGAELTAWVSAMPGSTRLTTKFSAAGYAPTGVRLVVDQTGAMHVRPVRRRRTSPDGSPSVAVPARTRMARSVMGPAAPGRPRRVIRPT